MTLPKRHLDTGQMDWQFLDVLWVHCPRCHQKTEYKRTRCQKCHHITCVVHCPCGFVFDTHTNPTYVGDIQKQEVRHRERCHYCGNQLLLKKNTAQKSNYCSQNPAHHLSYLSKNVPFYHSSL